MAKALRTAAFVVGAVALVAATADAAGIGIAGVAATTLTTVGAVASATSAVLSLAAAAATPKGSLGGNPTKFLIDRESGIPYVMGRCYPAGRLRVRTH